MNRTGSRLSPFASFVEAFGPVPAGRRRSFILKTAGFCKDMDLCTAHGDAVEPLPFHAMSGYPYGPDEHDPPRPASVPRLIPARSGPP